MVQEQLCRGIGRGEEVNAQDAYEKVRDFMDETVRSLTPEQYLDFLMILIGDLEGRVETTENEIADAELKGEQP